ncbi:MAG TPA: FliA/WhiG family RNA polymerase sigma factor [Nitrospiraceae bacterium]|nr:FliA/WhiG family RNA polymerase sigma factor [Nitrospiraceae bacterium]
MSTTATQRSRQIDSASDSHRELIIKEFAHIVKAMAYRLAYRLPAYMDAEDLVSVGIMGLMDAMDKYDPSREAKFKTYAEFRIRGAMLDEIRSMDWIPRSVHERVTLLQRTQAQLLNRLGRPPTDEEVAAEMKLSPAELDDFLVRSQGAVLVSLDDFNLHEPDGQKILDVLADSQHPDPLAIILNDRERERVADAIQQLPEKERLVLTLYYYEELTMKEIGRILKVTESRVCQIHTKAVFHLKGTLESLQ